MTATFAGMVACQVSTAVAAGTDRVALPDVGVSSNPMLLWGTDFELAFAAVVTYVPWVQGSSVRART